MLDTFFSARPPLMSRPHLRAYDHLLIPSQSFNTHINSLRFIKIVVNICFVHPNYRRRGVGRLLMEWGCKVADEMALEAFVESTKDGRELYKSNGFVPVRTYCFDVQPSTDEEGKDAEWLKVKNQIEPVPYPVAIMWRPKGGEFEEGKTTFPWED